MTVKNEAKNHKYLGRPVLGATLLMLWAFLICDGLCAFLSDINEMLTLVVSIVAGLGVMLFHKFYFRPELKSIASLSFFKNRKITVIAITFIVIDIMVVAMGCAREGFAFPTFTAFLGALMAGVAEEASFRVLPISVMMRAYKDSNKYKAALFYPAIVFGSYHIMNLLAGASLESTLLQIVSATIAGFFFAAIYLRTGSIVLPVFIHFLHDLMNSMIANQTSFVLDFIPGVMDYVETGIIAVVQIIMIVVMLRGHKKDIIDKWQEIWNTTA